MSTFITPTAAVIREALSPELNQHVGKIVSGKNVTYVSLAKTAWVGEISRRTYVIDKILRSVWPDGNQRVTVVADGQIEIQRAENLPDKVTLTDVPEQSARDWRDDKGHRSSCPVWGDDQMIESCTCGPIPEGATPVGKHTQEFAEVPQKAAEPHQQRPGARETTYDDEGLVAVLEGHAARAKLTPLVKSIHLTRLLAVVHVEPQSNPVQQNLAALRLVTEFRSHFTDGTSRVLGLTPFMVAVRRPDWFAAQV